MVGVRAREPDRCGFAVRDGVRLYYEVFGGGPPTVLLLPSWAIVHSRMWKMQVPDLARRSRVVTFDPRGNGRSDRPAGPASYTHTELAADAVAVLEATGTGSAIGIGSSLGAAVLLRLAADHPHRVDGAVFVSPAVALDDARPQRSPHGFDEEPDSDEGWATFNAHYWRRDLEGFASFFFSQAFVEAHSSKQVQDCVGWASETDAETLIATVRAPSPADSRDGEPEARRLAARVRCPSLVLHGDLDRIVGPATGPALAKALGCRLEIFHGAGHVLPARHPVRFNLVVRQFVERVGEMGHARERA